MLTQLFETFFVTLINFIARDLAHGHPRSGSFRCHVWPWGRSRRESNAGVPIRIDDAVTLGEAIPSALEAMRQGVEANRSVTLTTELRRRHVYILGSTGTGKTNCLLQLLEADAEAGRAVCLLDARGDLVDRALRRLASGHNVDALRSRLLLIDLRGGHLSPDEHVVGFNPLAQAGGDPYTRALFVLDVLRQQLGSALGVQTEETLRNCLLALAMAGGTLLEVEPMLTCPAFRQQTLQAVTDGAVRRFFERFDALPDTQQVQWTTPVLNKITPWLARPSLRRLLGQRGGISLRGLFDTRPDAIVLVCLGADELFGAAHLVGSLVVSAAASAVMRSDRPEGSRHPLFLYLDEFENFGGAGEQFEAIISEGRRFGLGLTLSHQASGQLSPRLRGLIRNVVATQIFFATGGLDAEALAGEIPSEEPKTVLRNLLMSQKVGEALVTRRGEPFVRLRTKHSPDPEVTPAAVADLRRTVLAAHGRLTREVDAELAAQEQQWRTKSTSPDGPKRSRTAPIPADKPLRSEADAPVRYEVRETNESPERAATPSAQTDPSTQTTASKAPVEEGASYISHFNKESSDEKQTDQ